MDIVKVRYMTKSGAVSGREYSYFSAIPLQVGDELMVPVRNGVGAAQVSAINVPEEEIAAFADKVKIIDQFIPVEPVLDLQSAEACADPLAD